MKEIALHPKPAQHDAVSDTLKLTFLPGQTTGSRFLAPYLSVAEDSNGQIAELTLSNATKYLRGFRDLTKIEVHPKQIERTQRQLAKTGHDLTLVKRYYPDVIDKAKDQVIDQDVIWDLMTFEDGNLLLRSGRSGFEYQTLAGPAKHEPTTDRLQIVFSQARIGETEQLAPFLTLTRTFKGNLASLTVEDASRYLEGVKDFSKIEVNPKSIRATRQILEINQEVLSLAKQTDPQIVDESSARFSQELFELNQQLPEGAFSNWRELFKGKAEKVADDALFRGWLNQSLDEKNRNKVFEDMATEAWNSVKDL